MPTPDDEIISVHASSQDMPSKARWKGGRCTKCGSVTPNEFVALLEAGALVSAWNVKKGIPRLAWFKVGQKDLHFAAVHLNDVSDTWLKDNAQIIAEMTGTLFWRENEHVLFKPFVTNYRAENGPLSVSLVKRINSATRRYFK